MLNGPQCVLNLDQLLTSLVAPTHACTDIVEDFWATEVQINVHRVELYPGYLVHILVFPEGAEFVPRPIHHGDNTRPPINAVDLMLVEFNESSPDGKHLVLTCKELTNQGVSCCNLLLCGLQEHWAYLRKLADMANLIH